VGFFYPYLGVSKYSRVVSVADKNKDKVSEDFDINENIYKSEFEDEFEDEDFTVREVNQKPQKDSGRQKQPAKAASDFEDDEPDDDFEDENKVPDKAKSSKPDKKKSFDDEDDDLEDEGEDDLDDDPKQATRPQKRKPITIKPVSEIRSRKIIKTKKIRPNGFERKKEPKSGNNWIWVILIVLSILVIGFLIYKMNPSILGSSKNNTTKGTITDDKTLAAVVNGEPIYMSEIDKRYASLSPQLQQLYSKEVIVNQSIDELLLLQDAKKMNISVTDQDVDKEIKTIMEENGLDQQKLEENLQAQGWTLDYLKDAFRKKLYIDELIKRITIDVKVTDAEVNEYYTNYSEIFQQLEQVTARHILISVLGQSNRTDDDARQLAADVRAQIKKDNSNFCDLVTKYSEDPGSVANCGEYTFSKGQMVKEFEDAAFTGKINETAIVKTQYGYHIIQTIAKIPAKQIPLSNVSAKIKETLIFDKQSQEVRAYLNLLKEKAEIVNYVANPNAPKVAIDSTNPETQKPTSETQTTTPVTENPETTTTTTTTETQPAETQQPSIDAASVASCLKEKGAVLYGASWKKDVRDQMAIFGDSKNTIIYVECDKNMPDANPAECISKGIDVYPTWIINTMKYTGVKSISDLKAIANC
jgi:parvulin-like peptidyl-prolyl isomerase